MKIYGYDYELVEDGDVDMIGALGRHHVRRQVLQIAEGMAQQQRESTVLHEILETLNYHNDLSLTNKVIMPLEAGLYQVLTDAGVDLSPLTKELDSNEQLKGKQDESHCA